jgi:hypothetical protein
MSIKFRCDKDGKPRCEKDAIAERLKGKFKVFWGFIKTRVNPSKFRLKTTKRCTEPTKHPLCGRFMSRIIATAPVF